MVKNFTVVSFQSISCLASLRDSKNSFFHAPIANQENSNTFFINAFCLSNALKQDIKHCYSACKITMFNLL